MAEQIPYGVAASLINKLASLAFLEIGRIYGVSDKLEDLKKTLESIHIVLSDAEQRQSEDPVIKHWISRFKQVLHGADDLLDGLAIKDLRCKVDRGSKGASKVRSFFSSENSLIFRDKLAHKIEKIQKSFKKVAEDMSNLKLIPSPIVPRQNENDWRETGSFVLQSDIIGREKDKNDVVDLLKQTHASQNVSLVAIVGIGGLGKTTLAQLVYDDVDVQNLFHKKMWVCVSEDFEVKLLLKKMLKSLEIKDVADLDLDGLQKRLREELNGHRYILVLDDVWNEDELKWSDLRTYLMCGGQGSKILVTTRSREVSQIMGINVSHVLNGLAKEQSWTLLRRVTFGDDTSRMSQSLQSIGERIAEKCGGVPLAIKTMGGFLRNTNFKCDEWSNVLNDDIWRLCKASQSIMSVLNLSYQNLPLGLRQCFAFCSLYPKDYKIEKDVLIQLWMAEGYLASSLIGTQSMEDVGNQYVKTLLMRSFFQDASMDDHGEITSFKLHDLMHDLAMMVAESDCYLVLDGKGIIGRPMHVAFHNSETIGSLDMLDASRLRTIIFHHPAGRLMTDPSFIQKLKYLRVLDLSDSNITQLPKSIDKIKHLRYLDLSGCHELISLPKSIGNLVCLQTLKLKGCFKLVFPTEVITKLINLRHLDIWGCKSFKEMMPTGLEKLTSLQYLSDFGVGGSGKLNELNELNNLGGDLEISGLHLVEDVASEAQESNLKAKRHIQRLKLRWASGTVNKNGDSVERNRCRQDMLKEFSGAKHDAQILKLHLTEAAASEAEEVRELISKVTEQYGHALYVLNWPVEAINKNSDSLQLLDHLCPHQNLKALQVTGYPGVRFSSWLSTLTNIVKIELSFFDGCQRVPPLERLPCLKTLWIQVMEELQCIHCDEISDVFFPSLETLIFEYCNNLRGWQRLRDDTCNHLSLPPFPRLSSLKIVSCPNLTCMPPFPHLVEKLQLISSSMKPLIETCSVQLEPSSLSPLHELRHLEIGDEVTDVEAMAEDWMQNLTFLKSLSFGGPSIIHHMLGHLQYLPTQLQELHIRDTEDDKLCLGEYEENNNMQCQTPFHCLRSLQKISFINCRNMKALPKQISDLQSLTRISIFFCPELESLPEAMCRLTNLQSLFILDCPLLLDRCQDESGQDWPKIAHIPNTHIRLS